VDEGLDMAILVSDYHKEMLEPCVTKNHVCVLVYRSVDLSPTTTRTSTSGDLLQQNDYLCA
jgi:hypothetical protein